MIYAKGIDYEDATCYMRHAKKNLAQSLLELRKGHHESFVEDLKKALILISIFILGYLDGFLHSHILLSFSFHSIQHL